MPHAHNRRSGAVKTFRDRPRLKPRLSREIRQYVNRGSSRRMHSVNSRLQDRKVMVKSPRTGEKHRNPIMDAEKGRTEMRDEVEVATINWSIKCGH